MFMSAFVEWKKRVDKVRKVCIILILVGFSAFISFGWRDLKGGVGARQISTLKVLERPPSVIDKEISQALCQPYFFWRSGSQSFAFLSCDERFVLKFPRASKISGYVRSFLSRNSRKISMMKSLCLCSPQLEKMTATMLVHLNGEILIPEKFQLFDRLNRQIRIDLSSIPFVLQYKKPLFSEVLDRAIVDKDLEKAQQMLSSFLDFLVLEWESGYIGTDYAFRDNFAYEEGKTYRIDVGSYEQVKNTPFSFEFCLKPVFGWLANRSPVLSEWLSKEVALRPQLGLSTQKAEHSLGK